ncbi:tRNA (guanine(37)-N(1))-methyltransferase [Chlamydia ibidis]|uniref:tRNA (guanine-N(1)-)-methyltransferase n=2 Tax=Chlamydia ibidis TaxID=1405396 RepID=S7J4R8_9CHLA|nr:tRNA (guanosine(37)-N1)-methyltransferase TrmD [Chlamydia ibidis]EPP35037.1 tRNA (guanine(37)-N(1))-methyltransferase [Chlamydia ibidis]EQM62584.1 tRNA (guanine-N1)-methyltransferase [Chlamydia ibidis 10-1398/6]
MEIDILSLFPEYFSSPLKTSILGRAIDKGVLSIRSRNIRDFGLGKWKQVDDVPFSGKGMLLMAEPVVRAIRSVRKNGSKVIYLSPQGALLTAEKSRELAQYSHLVFLCGHYEGVDERALESEVDEEISIGDYVLTNGGLAALVVIDALSRFVPGVLGKQESADADSLEDGLLEGPQYTRPRMFEGREVPEVLLQGNHQAISLWKKSISLERTRQRRPDLYVRYLYERDGEHFHTSKINASEAVKESSVILEVGDIKCSQRFYKKAFRLSQSQGERFMLPGTPSVALNLVQVLGPIKHLSVFSIRLQTEKDFLIFLLRWKMLGGTVEDHSQGTDLIRWARDLDGHVWVISCNKMK